jgi:putative redox protein
MARITVTHRNARSSNIDIRGYALVADEPGAVGGDDEGPTPTELIVAGAASCIVDEVERCLAEGGHAFAQLQVEADFEWIPGADRISKVRLDVKLSSEAGKAETDIVRSAILSCPALKMLTQPPAVLCHLNGDSVVSLNTSTDGTDSWPPEPPPDVDSDS